MAKKEFKNKCKAEKTKTYKLKRLSTILACVGFVIAAVTLFIDLQSNFENTSTWLGFGIAVIIAIVGGVLDVISDLKFNKEYTKNISNPEQVLNNAFYQIY